MDKLPTLYLDTLEKVLIDYHRISDEEYLSLGRFEPNWKQKLLLPLEKLLRLKDYTICKVMRPSKARRLVGADWPMQAETMIGLKRLKNIRFCAEKIIEEKIEGDFIETGIWRGGATIFMRAILKAYNETSRTVWVADSFKGLPPPNETKYIHDKGDTHHTQSALSVSIEDVRSNFSKYGLLDDQVKFLIGWFSETLPSAPIKKLSLLRLDGDMYESTIDALNYLYPKVTVGGYIIVDDWGAVPACQKAVLDYRERNKIDDELIPIDWAGVFWKKS